MKINTELKGGPQGRIFASSIEVNMSFTSVEEYMAWAAKVTEALVEAGAAPASTTPAAEPYKPQRPTQAGRKGKGKRPPMSDEAKRKAAATRARKKAEREAAEEDDILEHTPERMERFRRAFADGDDE